MKTKLFQLLKIIVNPFIGTGLGKIKPIFWLYRTVARSIIPDVSREVEVNGYKLFVRLEGGKDLDGIAQNLLFKSEYEPMMTQVFKEIVKPNMLVFDIGANIGYYTMLAAKLIGTDNYVWAFEPEPQNYLDLQYNMELNRLKNIVLVQKAVSNRNGKATFYVSREESGEHSLLRCRDKKHDAIEVDCISLDGMFGDFTKVNVIKTDTEGNDMDVVMGAKGLLNHNNVKIFLEFWPDGIESSGKSCDDCWDLLQQLGFKYIYLIDEFNKNCKITTLNAVKMYYNRYRFAANLLCSKEKIYD